MRSGYTLPVFATASAIAALQCLQKSRSANDSVTIDLINPPQQVEISIAQVALIRAGMALGITHSDPGDNLDLTRDTPVWAVVEWADPTQVESIALVGGEGVGKQSNLDNLPAIYAYAHQLLQANLAPLLIGSQKIRVTIILPAGKVLATRTSNAAFGVVEGLSLLGTTGISQPLSAPGQLDACLAELRGKSGKDGAGEAEAGSGERGAKSAVLGFPQVEHLFKTAGDGEIDSLRLGSLRENREEPTMKARQDNGESLPLVFCIGENGLDLAQQMGIKRDRIIKTANWLGPLLAEAGVLGVPKLLLFGYHGKLIKLAGGIFHTHHHLADGRLEILVTAAARMGLPATQLAGLFDCETAEDVLKYLREIDRADGSDWVQRIYGDLTERIDARSQKYIYSQSQQAVNVGSVVFDRHRQVIKTSANGKTLLTQLC